MIEMTIVNALRALGYEQGYAVNEHGIVLWDRPEPQPTEAELIAAGWVKPTQETSGERSASDPVEEEGSPNDPIPDSGDTPSDN